METPRKQCGNSYSMNGPNEMREDKGESRMITVPVYNMIILPNISLTFKKDFFDDASTTDIHEGDDVLFVF